VDGGERLGLPFVIDRRRLLAIDAAQERGLGRIEPINRIGKVFAVAHRLVGREGVGRESHVCVFLSSDQLAARRRWAVSLAASRIASMPRAWSSCLLRFWM